MNKEEELLKNIRNAYLSNLMMRVLGSGVKGKEMVKKTAEIFLEDLDKFYEDNKENL